MEDLHGTWIYYFGLVNPMLLGWAQNIICCPPLRDDMQAGGDSLRLALAASLLCAGGPQIRNGKRIPQVALDVT